MDSITWNRCQFFSSAWRRTLTWREVLLGFQSGNIQTALRFLRISFLPTAELPTQIRKNSWYDRLLYDVERSGSPFAGRSPDRTQAELVGGTTSVLWSDAIARHTALADLHLPATVQSIFFVIEENGHSPVSLKVLDPPLYGTIPLESAQTI